MASEQVADSSLQGLPPIPPEWKYVELDDLLESNGLSYGIVQPGSEDADGVPILRVKNLQRDGIRTDDVLRVGREIERQYVRSRLVGGEVLLSLVGSVGEVAVAPPSLAGWNVARAIAVIRVMHRANHWVRYYLSSEIAQHYIHIWQTTTVQATLNLRDVRRLPVAMPPIQERDAIVSLLGALDDKIVVNDWIAATSSGLALAHGRQALGVEQGHEVSMSECALVTKGVSYRSDDLTGNDGVLISLKCVGRDGQFQPDGAKPFNGECRSGQVLHEGEIVVAQTDLTQRAEVIGRPSRVVNLGGWSRMVASLDLGIVRPQDGLTSEVIFALLSSEKFHDHALSHCNGTTVLHMSARAFPTFKFNKPSDEVVSRVTSIMRPLFVRSDQARRENQSLTKLRDTLLPRLMSGEIRAREAERVVGDVT